MGHPVMTPIAGLKFNPAGSAPTLNVAGSLEVRVYVKVCPCLPLAARLLVISGTDEAMVSVRTWLSPPYMLVAPMAMGNVPLTIGAPEIIPATGSRLRPLGSTLALNR